MTVPSREKTRNCAADLDIRTFTAVVTAFSESWILLSDWSDVEEIMIDEIEASSHTFSKFIL